MVTVCRVCRVHFATGCFSLFFMGVDWFELVALSSPR